MPYQFRKQWVVFLSILAFVSILSCKKYQKALVKEQYLDSEIPSYGIGNPTTIDAQIHLGRVLFYEKSLSINNSVSCASCHKQQFAFADNVALSPGFENRLTKRNSIAIQNLTTGGIFFEPPPLFWDGREFDLASLISKPIANHIEMGMDNQENRLSTSMASFLTLINSSKSRFDQSIISGSKEFDLSPIELRGKQLFQTTYQCTNCHNPSVGGYNNSQFINIGLEVNTTDKGRMNITNAGFDEGSFKVPDLHNVALTAPYMHDGRFKTLNEVLDHYSHGIQDNNNLSDRLRNNDGSTKKLNISEEDKSALIAFLNSMTDYTVLTNPLFSNPFKYK
jgi:cytochrome c peroxidase